MEGELSVSIDEKMLSNEATDFVKIFYDFTMEYTGSDNGQLKSPLDFPMLFLAQGNKVLPVYIIEHTGNIALVFYWVNRKFPLRKTSFAFTQNRVCYGANVTVIGKIYSP